MLFLLLATLVIGNTASAKILSSSKTKVTVQKGSKACVIITLKKDGMVYYQNMNNKIAAAKWGKSEDGRIKLYIKGKKVGQSKIFITNSKNKEKVVIRVKVKKKSGGGRFKYRKCVYYKAKHKMSLYIGSRWDKGNEVTVYSTRPGDPHHLDSFSFRYKNGKLIGEAGVITFKKNKAIWNVKNVSDLVWNEGTYIYKGKDPNY